MALHLHHDPILQGWELADERLQNGDTGVEMEIRSLEHLAHDQLLAIMRAEADTERGCAAALLLGRGKKWVA